jgi:hypothetical protein
MARVRASKEETEARTAGRVQDATTRLLGMWGSGQMPERVAAVMLRRQAGDGNRPSDSWSLTNQLVMLAHDTEDARGFDQWKEVGRAVIKGAKAFYILGPVFKKVADDEAPEGERSVCVGFKAIPVFAVEDTEGDDLAVADYSPPVLPPLHEVAEAWGLRVTWGAGARSAYGWYRSGARRIHLMTHDEGTFLHELAHAAHDRLGGLVKAGRGQDPRLEIVAETTAAALALLYGFEGYVVDAREYVASYGAAEGDQDASKAVLRHLAEVQKVLDLILSTAAELSGGREEVVAAA